MQGERGCDARVKAYLVHSGDPETLGHNYNSPTPAVEICVPLSIVNRPTKDFFATSKTNGAVRALNSYPLA